MLWFERARWVVAGLLFLLCARAAGAQAPAARPTTITITAVDENGVVVAGAIVTVYEPGESPAALRTDYAGRCAYTLHEHAPYRVQADKPGFYQADQSGIEPDERIVRIVLAHEQYVREQVNVTASKPGIDTDEVSNAMAMNTPEIVNVPYPTSRDIRDLLPFYPGVVQDATGQVHIDGSQTWQALDTLDGFDIRSPAEGTLDMRVSTDAVRTIDEESTRYPVEFGRATGGLIAFYTGMGDNKFRFNATNFTPSFRDLNGIRFDKYVPRFTFSGPIVRDRAWWFDGVDFEYDNVYIQELPANADTNELVRGSNLVKAQTNLRPDNILTAGLLFNDYHSPYEGISSLVPQQSTTNRDIIAWLPYLRDQWSFHRGALLDIGAGEMRYRDGHEPHGSTPYQITPEQAEGSYFENLTGRSHRVEGTAALYLPPIGEHSLRMGADLDRVSYNQDQSRAPVSYLREDGTLDRQSVFAPAGPFALHNDEIGAYLEDRWRPAKEWLIEPGLRFDWDAIVRRPLVAPRVAAVWAPGGSASTKISAGIGLYYDRTQLEYVIQPFAGTRYDTYYADDSTPTPLGPAQQTTFTDSYGLLHEPRAVNWSAGIERKLPGSIYGGANYIQKQTSDVFTFVNQSGPAALAGDYLLTNARLDRYRSEEFDLRRDFAEGYAVFVAYTHSSARTNAALEYLPTPSPLGPQQSGPLAWDTPNRTIAWGWLPLDLPRLKKSWDVVYTLDWHSGFPYTAVNAADEVVGAAGAYRFPEFIDFGPGLEWRFHFRGEYYGLRGVMENALDRANPAVVNNDVDSPQFGAFTEPQGRGFTARLRLIGAR